MLSAAVWTMRPWRGLEAPVLPHDPASDSELLERIAREDHEAFREFYSRYGARLLVYARRLSADGRGAEDLVQDVFLAVWRKAASYRPDRGGVPGWLFSILRNRVVDLWRRKGGWVEESGFDFRLLESQDPGDQERLGAVAVRQALLRLKPEQQEALRLAYFGGLTYEETARRLGLPLGTLKSRIRSGLLTLRRWLSPSEVEEPGPGTRDDWVEK